VTKTKPPAPLGALSFRTNLAKRARNPLTNIYLCAIIAIVETKTRRDEMKAVGEIIMANPEHVEVVKNGAAAIIEWRARNQVTRLHLHGADLRGAYLREAYLYGANLYGANLREANLREASLRTAYLSSAKLYGANLLSADLREANLCGADLYGADLRGADLRGTDLYGANLSCANLSEANLCGANLRGAYLSEANLSWAYLSEADLGGANLYGANLSATNLRGADLSGAGAIWSCGPGGSRYDMCYIVQHDHGLMVNCGCFWGTLAEFEAAVEETHGDNEHGKYYRAVIEAAKAWQS
jgi:hypothetical protein